MTIESIVVTWTGFPGAPGYSTFYGTSGSGLQTALVTFFNSVKAKTPSNVTWTIPADGDQINEANGDVTGSWAGGTVTAVAGTVTGAIYGAPAGAVVNWKTGDFVNSRRVVGRTFLVPLDAGGFDNDGSLSATLRSALTSYATTFLGSTSPSFLIWHRPSSPGATDGSSHVVTSVLVPDKVAILRKRRP